MEAYEALLEEVYAEKKVQTGDDNKHASEQGQACQSV